MKILILNFFLFFFFLHVKYVLNLSSFFHTACSIVIPTWSVLLFWLIHLLQTPVAAAKNNLFFDMLQYSAGWNMHCLLVHRLRWMDDVTGSQSLKQYECSLSHKNKSLLFIWPGSYHLISRGTFQSGGLFCLEDREWQDMLWLRHGSGPLHKAIACSAFTWQCFHKRKIISLNLVLTVCICSMWKWCALCCVPNVAIFRLFTTNSFIFDSDCL